MSLKDAIREAAGERDKQNHPPQFNTPINTPIKADVSTPITHPVTPPSGNQSANQMENSPSTGRRNQKTAPITSIKAVNTASHKAVRQSVKQSDIAHNETAAMTVRVSKRHRLHWLIAAKREGTSLTAAITEALNARFGEPTD